MKKCAEAVTSWLLRYQVIMEEDRELYNYAVYNILFSLFPLFMAMTFGGIMGCVRQSVVLILPFMMIRKFSGGYHTKHPWSCLLCSSLSLLLCIEIAVKVSCNWELMILTIIAGCSLMVFSPIDSENRKLCLKDKYCYQRCVWGIVGFFIILLFVLKWLGAERDVVSVSVGILLSAGMQLPCIMKKLIKHQK